MSFTRLLFPALVLALVLGSCDFERVTDLETPPYTPRLVVLALPTPDSVFSVRVSRSIAAVGSDRGYATDIVQGAQVTVFGEGGEALEVLRLEQASPGYRYRSSREVTAEAGRRYTVRVAAPGFPTAEATTQVPEPIPFVLEAGALTDGTFSDRTLPVRLMLPDTPGEQVYQVSFEQPYTLTRTDLDSTVTYSYSQPALFASLDPALRSTYEELGEAEPRTPNVPGGGRAYYSALFRDDPLGGEPRVLEMEVAISEFEDRPGLEIVSDEIIVTVRAISDDYVRYQQSIARQDANGDNPFSEPTPLYSNVEGGLGVFAGVSVYRQSVSIE